MDEQEPIASTEANGFADPWRGIDLSGTVVVLGPGTGRLLDLLGRQVAAARGTLLVISPHRRALSDLASAPVAETALRLASRPRHLPLLSETVDLLVVNSVLREVPENRLRAQFEEFWRVLVPGGRLRVSDIIEPTEAEQHRAWSVRNRIVRKLGESLNRPTALSVDLQATAKAIRAVGFDDLAVSLLPGYALTDAWLEETVNAIHAMAGRLVDRAVRDELLQEELRRLNEAYRSGQQRAAGRFVLQGKRAGDLALDMESPFTEEDLAPPED